MNKEQLFNQIQKKRSFLCVGLDPVMELIPEHLLEFENPVLEFNKQIIDATQDLCVAYKPNTAFYECLGLKGWETLQKTKAYIPESLFTIADAKRGDIGNTSNMYAKAFLSEAGELNFDSITVAPYMGKDSVTPFLGFQDKWVILLALTSNKGHEDFQLLKHDDEFIFEHVLKVSSTWATDEQMMYVVGATHPESFQKIRTIVPNHFLLVPGVGAQGGDLQSVCKYGLNSKCGLLINAGRSIIFASKGRDFAEKARAEALKLQVEMDIILSAADL